jgi:protein TonB
VPGGVPGGSPQGVPGGVPGGKPAGVPGGQGDGRPAPLTPPVKKAAPKPAGPTEAEIKELSDEYKSGVKSAILGNKSYPEMAQRLQHTGKVGLLIKIGADGSLESVSVSSSSGYDELDEAALDAVRAAAPFEAFPEGIGKSVIKFSMSLRYSL